MPGLSEQEYELVPVDQLRPHPANPRQGDVDGIRESIEANDFYGAVVAQRSTGHVLAGNHRLLAAEAEGLDVVPVLWLDVDDDRARRILLADNRTNDKAGYDANRLAALLGELRTTEAELAGTGYTEADFLALVGEGSVGTELPADEGPGALPAEVPVTQPGDVWLLGPHRLLCGDATDTFAVEEFMAGEHADCMWTDPPYGVDYVGKTKDALVIDNDAPEGLPQLLEGAFATATRVLRAGAPVYVAHPAGPLSLEFARAFIDAGWLLRQTLVWVKNQAVLGHSDYHYQHELILYGFTPRGEGRLGRGGERWYGDHAQTSVFEVPHPHRSEDHPTMKPVELITTALGNSCATSGLVYDAFGGSGSTLIASHATGRIARLVELDPRYCDVICRRFQKLTDVTPVAAATGEPHDFLEG